MKKTMPDTLKGDTLEKGDALDGGAPKSSGQRSSLGAVYKTVRSAILHSELEPGSVVSQVKLSQLLGVSRTPLREALRLLQNEGLVESSHNRRVTISMLSLSDMEELYALRICVEAHAVGVSAPRLTKDDLALMGDAVAEMNGFIDAENIDGWEAPHRRFHRTLMKYAGPRNSRLLEELSDHSERYRRWFIAEGGHESWQSSAAEHRAMFEACAEGNAIGARETLAKHLARTALTLFLHLAPEYEPTKVRAALRSVLP